MLGFISALWGWAEGVSLWGVLGSYVLGGALGVIASAMGALLGSYYGLRDKDDSDEISLIHGFQSRP